MSRVQDASSIFEVGFAPSKSPHLHRAYLLTFCNQKLIAVAVKNIIDSKRFSSDFKDPERIAT